MGAKGEVYLGGSPWKVGKLSWAITRPTMGLLFIYGFIRPIKPMEQRRHRVGVGLSKKTSHVRDFCHYKIRMPPRFVISPPRFVICFVISPPRFVISPPFAVVQPSRRRVEPAKRREGERGEEERTPWRQPQVSRASRNPNLVFRGFDSILPKPREPIRCARRLSPYPVCFSPIRRELGFVRGAVSRVLPNLGIGASAGRVLVTRVFFLIFTALF
jgi:hypothetical protein